jgi:hypothetical protein
MSRQIELTKEDLWEVMRAYFVREGLRELIQSLGDLEVKTKYGNLINVGRSI